MALYLNKMLLTLALAAFATDKVCALRGNRDLQSFSVAAFELIEVGSNEVVAEVSDGAVISIAPGTGYSMNVVTTGSVGSVRFGYNGETNFRTESRAPYAFCGDVSGNFRACSQLVAGTSTVTATPFSRAGARGTAGTTQSITFTLTIGSSPIAAPVPPPVPAPVPPPVPAPVAPPVPAPVAPVPSGGCGPPKLIGNWEDAAEYPIDRVLESQGAIIGSDFVIVSGFVNGISAATKENYALDLTNPNASWRRIKDLPVAQGITHGAFVVVGSKFYMCGGYLGGHPGPHIDTCVVYDHDENEWDFFASLPDGRAGGGMIHDSINNALVFSAGAERPVAGNANAVDFQHTWMYSLSNPGRGWVEKDDIPYLTNHMSYATARDARGRERHFFLAGQIGENERTGNADDNYEWDVASESWIAREFMPFTRGHASSSTNAVNCGFIIAAGSTNEMGRTSDVSYYDASTDTWTKVGDLPASLNTPVCDIDFNGGWYYCFTGQTNFQTRIRIEL